MKISSMTAGSAMDGTEKIPGIKGAGPINNFTWLMTQLADYILGGADPSEAALLSGLMVNIQDQFDDLVADLLNTDNNVAGKEDKIWITLTGGFLLFNRRARYGTLASPVTANITFNSGNAPVVGIKVLVIHQKAVAPTFGAEFVARSDSAAYDTTKINYIEMQVVDSVLPTIHYKIYQV